MISQSKNCYECQVLIPSIITNLRGVQTSTTGVNFLISGIVIKCPNGHKNALEIITDEVLV